MLSNWNQSSSSITLSIVIVSKVFIWSSNYWCWCFKTLPPQHTSSRQRQLLGNDERTMKSAEWECRDKRRERKWRERKSYHKEGEMKIEIILPLSIWSKLMEDCLLFWQILDFVLFHISTLSSIASERRKFISNTKDLAN